MLMHRLSHGKLIAEECTAWGGGAKGRTISSESKPAIKHPVPQSNALQKTAGKNAPNYKSARVLRV